MDLYFLLHLAFSFTSTRSHLLLTWIDRVKTVRSVRLGARLEGSAIMRSIRFGPGERGNLGEATQERE